MRAIVQRVSSATVEVQEKVVGSIGRGLVVFVGIGKNDKADDADYIAGKVLNLRIFPDSLGRFDKSCLDINASLLIVSQFTLYANTRKGRRPSFAGAALPEEARLAFELVVEQLRSSGLPVATGCFGQHMDVKLINQGPVTIWLDSNDRLLPREDKRTLESIC